MGKFKLTRSEFAKKLEISTDNLKKRMRRGQYKDQYIFENGKYLFSGDAGVGPIKQKIKPVSLGTKKKRNRGNHLTSTNPRYSNQLRQHNEMKMLAKLKHKVDQEVQDLIPEAVELAKQKKRERLQKQLNTPLKPVYTHGIENMSKTYVQSVGLMPYSKLSTYSSAPRGTITHKTEFKDVFTKPKDEYDTYLEENDLKGPTKKFYW